MVCDSNCSLEVNNIDTLKPININKKPKSTLRLFSNPQKFIVQHFMGCRKPVYFLVVKKIILRVLDSDTIELIQMDVVLFYNFIISCRND